VMPWQLLSRLLRAASLASFLIAFGLPATPAAVAVVMVAQGGGRLLPLAPASAAATVAVLAAGFPGATGVHVGVPTVAAFVLGMSTVLTVVGIALAAAVAIALLGSPGVKRLREALVPSQGIATRRIDTGAERAA
jgi:hypothetical protein